jgi:hypothetical protein
VMKQGGEVYWKCVFLTCEVSIDIGIAKHKIQQGLYLHLKWYYPFPLLLICTSHLDSTISI